MERFSSEYYSTLITQRNQLAKDIADVQHLERTRKPSKKKEKSIKQMIADAPSAEDVVHILRTFGVLE